MGQQGSVLMTIPFKYIIENLIAFLPGVVDVEIGRRGAPGIDEALK